MYLPILALLYVLMPCTYAKSGCHNRHDKNGCPAVIGNDVFDTAIEDFCRAHMVMPRSVAENVSINVGATWPRPFPTLPIYDDKYGNKVSFLGMSTHQGRRLTSKSHADCTSWTQQANSLSLQLRKNHMSSTTILASFYFSELALAMVQMLVLGPIARWTRIRRMEDEQIRILELSLRRLSVHLGSTICRGDIDLSGVTGSCSEMIVPMLVFSQYKFSKVVCLDSRSSFLLDLHGLHRTTYCFW